MGTRDMTTLPTDGEQATQFEAPTARDSEAPAMVNRGAGAATTRQRPSFSPVAQPGQVEEIHWHTVKSEQRAPGGEPPARPTRGMIGRFHQHHHGGRKQSNGGS
jgi:hypothetical protein